MTRFALLLGVLLATAGCSKDPVSSSTTNNPNLSVDLLFEHEGVRVYRFYDGGRAHYYAVPRSGGAATFTTWSETRSRLKLVRVHLRCRAVFAAVASR